MELLSPAGDEQKLATAYEYGADAAYLGISEFSLRTTGFKINENSIQTLKNIKEKYKGKKLYGAVNMYFFENDIQKLKEFIPYLKQLPLDAVIVSDLGCANIIKNNIPQLDLHLSVQASCTNSESIKVYKDLGFKRIILSREVSLENIRKIHKIIPEMELEAFVHGAMCMAVSGRCIMSLVTTGRSANKGECSHSCRWKYKTYIEEEERKGEYLELEENNGFNTILSSRDLNMIDHLEELKDAGLTSLKIEGRMKSIYYCALITRAYRKALDNDKNKDLYIKEIDKVSHREWTTGFYYEKEKYNYKNHINEYIAPYKFLGIVGKKIKDDIYEIDIKNQIKNGDIYEVIGPDIIYKQIDDLIPLDKDFCITDHIDHCMVGYIKTKTELKEGYILRKKI